jgi:pyocin large subunit-like protein
MKNKIVQAWILFVLIGIAMPVCCQSDTLTSVEETIQAGNFAPGQLEAHYLKHGYPLGYNSQEQYLQGARALLNAPVGNDVYQKIRANGDVERYRTSSGEFAVMTKNGRIRTYFKTDYSYWTRQ